MNIATRTPASSDAAMPPAKPEHAVGSGTDALAAAYFLINVDGQRVVGMAFDTDSLGASLKALISAINRSEVAVQIAA